MSTSLSIKNTIFSICILAFLAFPSLSQIPRSTAIQIVKAEDARRYDKTLEDLMHSQNEAVRIRAALAAGRIGDEAAIRALTSLLEKETSVPVQAMAAFALGEIESIEAADAILRALNESEPSPVGDGSSSHSRMITGTSNTRPQPSATADGSDTRARLVEAAGKIAAANPRNEKSKLLGEAIVRTLNEELNTKSSSSTEIIRHGLTAVLRARPAGAEDTVRKFLAFTDLNIVADALNTLARLRAKNANRDARDLLATHTHAIVRANAARVLGAAEDKEAVDVLIKAATGDTDSRVRVSSIRALASIKDAKAAEQLVERGEILFSVYEKSKFANPVEKNELLEIATALGRLIPGTRNERAIKFLDQFAIADDAMSPEISLARLRIAPGNFNNRNGSRPIWSWKQRSTNAQMLAELATIDATTDDAKKMKSEAPDLARALAQGLAIDPDKETKKFALAAPDFLRAFAAYKTDDLEGILREALRSDDVFVRATAAELLADNTPSPAARIAIENAFKKALVSDKHDNDAQLAMLDAMAKINKTSAVDTIYLALDATDYLVRKKAFELLDDAELIRKYPGVVSVIENARRQKKNQVLPYNPKSGTKLGQVLNTDADYRRALSRKNGTVKAVVTTEKGVFAIDLLPEDAPLSVDNFIKLARSGYFNGLEVHRVVPNFVMQDGDPRGDGNGGPGWSIRCEINMVPYERGAVGMALSGKDTGGSQWFVTHSPQPHLDGGYTVFGRVNETGMKVVDRIVRGDKIVSIRIVGR